MDAAFVDALEKWANRSATSQIIPNQSVHDIIPSSREHPLINEMRNFVRQFRLSDPGHFQRNLVLHQASQPPEDNSAFTSGVAIHIMIYFHECFSECETSTQDLRRCVQGWDCPSSCDSDDVLEARKRNFRQCRLRKAKSTRTGEFSELDCHVKEGDTYISLYDFLRKHYSTPNIAVAPDVMRDWWKGNGKSFNWISLPNELKESVIQNCFYNPPEPRPTWMRTQTIRYSPRYKRISECGIYEIFDKIGAWAALTSTSRQIRAITLRLAFSGSSDLQFNKGFMISCLSYTEFCEKWNRLGSFFQMIEPNSIPTDALTAAVAKRYHAFPRIFPELRQYATFRQGLRHVLIKMDWVAYMRFFNITSGTFTSMQRYKPSKLITCEAFSQLPNLTHVTLLLPVKPELGWKDPSYHTGPPLFHAQNPCPRVLHRFIYERAAKALALVENVEIRNFMDSGEEARFLAARATAINALKFTALELEELYAEDAGGVSLGELVPCGTEGSNLKDPSEEPHVGFSLPRIAALRCHCEVPCRLAFVTENLHKPLSN